MNKMGLVERDEMGGRSRHVRVSCEKFNYQDFIGCCSHNQKLTYEKMPGTEADRPGCAIPAHSLLSIHAFVHKHTPQKKGDNQATHARTFFPSKRSLNDGIAVTSCSRATIESILTAKSTLANATRSAPFVRTSSSNTGSIILRGAHVADVNIATTTRCEPSRLRNDAGFVDGWMVVVMIGLVPRALVESERVL